MLWAWMSVALAADVAIVLDGREGPNGFTEPVTDELQGLARGEELTTETFFADFDPEGAAAALDAAFASDARVIAAIGPLVAETVLSRGEAPKPTIAALALSDREPPPNVTLLQLENSLEAPLEQLAHILGSDRVAVALPPFLATFAVELEGLGDIVVVAPGESPPELDGVLVGGTTLVPAERDALFARWTDAGVASLFLGGRELPPHALGVYLDTGEQNPISRRVALTAVNLLEGRPVSSGTVAFHRGDLVLSADVMDRLGLSLPFDVLADADVVGWEDRYPRLELVDVVAEAFENSPELASLRARIDGENTGPASARASWLPAIDAGATASQLDEAIASAVQPETRVTADVTASQLLWSDGAATNVRVQRDLVESRSAELVAAEQDLAYDIGIAYVTLERAQAVIEVRAADIDRARLSLQVARQRTRAGDAAPIEVSRWEAEVANARASLVQAWTDFRAAMIDLNRRAGVTPVDRNFLPEELELGPGSDFAERLNNPRTLDRVAGIVAEVGVERAPELQQLDNATTAQRRLKKLADRAYFMPTVAAQGSVNFNIYQTPADPIELPGVGPIELVQNPPAYWTLGASASVPVFSGGQRRADQVKARHDVASLEHQQRQIELAVRSRAAIAVNQAHGAAWRAELRQVGADAALDSLEAAIAAYAAGTATQTTVTEARTNALQFQLAATDARYEATLRLMDLLRAAAAVPTPDDPDSQSRLRALLLERLEAAQ